MPDVSEFEMIEVEPVSLALGVDASGDGKTSSPSRATLTIRNPTAFDICYKIKNTAPHKISVKPASGYMRGLDEEVLVVARSTDGSVDVTEKLLICVVKCTIPHDQWTLLSAREAWRQMDQNDVFERKVSVKFVTAMDADPWFNSRVDKADQSRQRAQSPVVAPTAEGDVEQKELGRYAAKDRSSGFNLGQVRADVRLMDVTGNHSRPDAGIDLSNSKVPSTGTNSGIGGETMKNAATFDVDLRRPFPGTVAAAEASVAAVSKLMKDLVKIRRDQEELAVNLLTLGDDVRDLSARVEKQEEERGKWVDLETLEAHLKVKTEMVRMSILSEAEKMFGSEARGDEALRLVGGKSYEKVVSEAGEVEKRAVAETEKQLNEELKELATGMEAMEKKLREMEGLLQILAAGQGSFPAVANQLAILVSVLAVCSFVLLCVTKN